MLSKAQLKKIEEVIRKKFLRFTFEHLGPEALTEYELAELKRLGLLRKDVKNFVADGYTIGKVAEIVDRGLAETLTEREILKLVRKMAIPTTPVETSMINWATSNAGRYISGIRDEMVKEVHGVAARSAVDTIRQQVAGAIKNRKTVGELKTALYDAINDRYRDWQRVASTELQGAIQSGIFHEIKESHGLDQLVFKRPTPQACKYCKKLYLKGDGFTPQVFKLSDLADSNYGLKASSWRATVGPVHPYCQCQLQVVPDGYDFKTSWTASEEFSFEGKKYGKGEVISDSVYARLGPKKRLQTRQDAVLGYTGSTALESTEKSFGSHSEEDDDCLCCY